MMAPKFRSSLKGKCLTKLRLHSRFRLPRIRNCNSSLIPRTAQQMVQLSHEMLASVIPTKRVAGIQRLSFVRIQTCATRALPLPSYIFRSRQCNCNLAPGDSERKVQLPHYVLTSVLQTSRASRIQRSAFVGIERELASMTNKENHKPRQTKKQPK